MPYRLIALDLDGTTVVEGRPPSPGVRRAIAAAEAHGVRVVLATGRPYQSALRFAAALDLANPIICFQGALVKAVEGDRRTLLAEGMPRAPLLELLAFAEAHDLDFTLYSEQNLYTTGMRHPQSFYDLWFGLDVQHVARLEDGLREIDAAGLCPLKCLIIGEPEQNDGLILTLRERFAGRLEVVRSHALFVEAVSPAVSKGHALAALAQRLGIAQEEVLAVGDSGNDLSMVQWAGMGVAVANASSDVRAAADWIAPSAVEDGVAAVVERFVLRNGRVYG